MFGMKKHSQAFLDKQARIRDAIQAGFDEGKSKAEVAAMMNIACVTVDSYVKKFGLTPPPKRSREPEMTSEESTMTSEELEARRAAAKQARVDAMVERIHLRYPGIEDYLSKETLSEVAARYGVSRQRVQQVANILSVDRSRVAQQRLAALAAQVDTSLSQAENARRLKRSTTTLRRALAENDVKLSPPSHLSRRRAQLITAFGSDVELHRHELSTRMGWSRRVSENGRISDTSGPGIDALLKQGIVTRTRVGYYRLTDETLAASTPRSPDASSRGPEGQSSDPPRSDDGESPPA